MGKYTIILITIITALNSSLPELMDKRFVDGWDLKILKAKINQKYRDSKCCC